MKSNYKRIGDTIQQVNVRNVDLKATNLLGINIDKFFMPSVANVVGTDMSTYKIVKNGQFACNRMHVGRDYRLPVALSKSDEDFLVSPAYDVFEIKDTATLLPEFLMMWFSRKEFDRNAWFYTDADVRGGLDWEAFCDMTLPIPSPDKQREIVKEYNTILQRIDLNNGLIQKLEETAQAIYKQWFVDFEFPAPSALASTSPKFDGTSVEFGGGRVGVGYKSAGGEMVESELGDIPKGWEVKTLGNSCAIYDYLRKPLSEIERQEIKGVYPYYGAMSIVDYINDYIFDGIYLLFSEDGVYVVDKDGHPSLQYVWGKFWVNNHAHILQGDDLVTTEFLYLALKNSNVTDLVTGAAQPKINQDNMSSIKIIIPNEERLKEFNKIISPFFAHLRTVAETNDRVEKLREILLSKLATVTD